MPPRTLNIYLHLPSPTLTSIIVIFPLRPREIALQNLSVIAAGGRHLRRAALAEAHAVALASPLQNQLSRSAAAHPKHRGGNAAVANSGAESAHKCFPRQAAAAFRMSDMDDTSACAVSSWPQEFILF